METDRALIFREFRVFRGPKYLRCYDKRRLDRYETIRFGTEITEKIPQFGSLGVSGGVKEPASPWSSGS